MLQSIHIAGTATYSSAGSKFESCKPVNFIFGTNGSGKTTISRVIADPAAHSGCQLTWAGGREVERLVYNLDFVERNFTTNPRGIFTLGSDSIETSKQIEKAKDAEQEHQEQLTNHFNTLRGPDGTGGKQGDREKLRAKFKEMCWQIKDRHEAEFAYVFKGLTTSKAKFCEKLLSEQTTNAAASCELDDLKTRASSVFRDDQSRLTPVALPNLADLVQLELSPILIKNVVGKEDVNVSALITRLSNSDWVKQGRAYLDHSGNVCPFCQQQLLSDLARDLNTYFDEGYARDLAAIERLRVVYETYSSAVLKRLDEIATTGGAHLSVYELRGDTDRLAQRVELNKRQIARKKREPSAIIALESLADVVADITARLNATNDQIARHNELVDNITAERKRLIAEVWRYILDESKVDIGRYASEKSALDKAVACINTEIEHKQAQLAAVKSEIAGLERSITSVEPTVNEINGILASFGFTSFKLATAGDRGSIYKLVRHDGSDALKTLSEGEKSFITFLYFYHLIRGSVSASGVTVDRIIVFDDPVSSLDSDVLFVVSSLIKRVIEDARSGASQVKQVFVLTHNIYFHKEVSFDSKRKGDRRNKEAFWIVRKQDDVSVLTSYNHNPIKTSYELLWSEVRDANRSPIFIRNILRRIMETYFKLLGGVELGKLPDKFEGREKLICSALLSWMHDGSHAVHDDLHVSVDESDIERYQSVFKSIFDKLGHAGHYNMMMGLEGDQVAVQESKAAGEAA